MRRRIALTLPLALALPRPGAAQPAPPAGGDAMRSAGRQALAFAQQQRWAEADAAAASADPLIRKLVTWLRLQSRGTAATAAEVAGFALANPDWPGQPLLERRVEEALAAEPDDRLAFDWFAARAPRSLDGYQRLADALARAGKAAEAATVVRSGWVEGLADAAAEPGYLERNAASLAPEQHWRRFDRLALGREAAAAGRLVGYLDPARQGIAAARLAYAADQPDADAPALAAAAAGDAALGFERARWLRRRDRDAEAAAAWASNAVPSPEVARAAWPERQLLARKLLRLGDARAAYAVSARHGIEQPGEPRQEAEFLAGFIALRRLEDAAEAERHFTRLAEGSRSVITRARSLYWQGRALAARGDAAGARRRWAAAAEFPLAFYGQLAALALGEDGAALSARIARTPGPAVPARQADAFAAKELARLVLALADIGETRRARPFLLRLEELAPDPAEKALAARLGARIGRPDHAVWVVRRAGASGAMLLEEGWPAPYPAPAFGPEAALVNAITRQESNFDPEAVSPANARGLMQLLPGTAQQVARRIGAPYAVGLLTQDPGLNMRLGAAYLEQLIGRFGGALPFAIAGYNAGPGRVDEWLGTNGDPRTGAVPMLDWMELIPFGETRNYVQRVVENMTIYRARDAGAAGGEHPMAQWLRG
ncbi:lytic transglycosylase domain-containing protein [Paeniroseomonas aquatica]|uniref:Lytic transglycosylase domain-containing protein n=1 Tax=Paeniroseomonas aquatica TaxID=373043 RepID=A0ABT8ADU2_9PROT|nr:lytic transglycosylase domain-containing protein [Paeniroseomonas aquatica]MDN3567927.1 lytic transglycosylase domain-containing protein [Paeniroseomonas aquatica]